MDRNQYATCRSSASGDILEDEASEFLEKIEPRRWWLSANPKVCQTIVGLILILTLLNALSLYIWLYPTYTAAPKKEPTVLNYFLTSGNGQRRPDIIERVYWDYDDDFLNFNLTIAHEAWASLLPPGEGLVALTPEEVASLNLHHSQPARRDPSKRIYLVGVFHQLHCLSVLRAQTIHLFQNPDFSIQEATYHHTMHCADVLRQALLCAADSSLIFKDENIKWPGDGGKLMCRNFEALKDWTLAHNYISG